MPKVHGPFATAEQAMRAIEPLRAALNAVDPHGVATGQARHRQIELRLAYVAEALGEADATPGAFGQIVARWLAGQPLEYIAVVLDWIARAGASGNVALLAEAAEWIEPCPARTDGRCPHGNGAWAACERTDLAYRLRGLDPAEARRHALDALGEE